MLVQSYPERKFFGDLITADHKIISEESESRNNHRYAVVVQDLATQWLQSYPCKTKTSQETQKSPMKLLEPTRKPKVIYTDNSLEFGKILWRITLESLYVNATQIGNTWDCWESSAQSEKGTCAVLLQSGLDNEWWADSMECYYYLRNIHDILSYGETPYERRFGILFNGPVISFGAMDEYHPISASDQSRLHQFGPKVLPGMFLGYALHVVGIWKGDILNADIEELEQMDASETHARRLNAKEVSTPMKGDKNIFPIADGTVKICGGDQRLRTSTLIWDRPERGEEQEMLQGESGGLSPPPPPQDDSTLEDAEAKNDFWSTTGEFIYRHHVELRVKLYMPREESFLIPLKYIDVTRTTHTSLDVLLEQNIDDCWNVDGDRGLSDTWTGFTRFFFLNGRPPDGYTWSGERLTRKQTTSRPDNVWPDMWKHMCDASKRKEKQSKSGLSRNQSSIMPDNYVMMKKLKHEMENGRRKLEIPMPAAMPCKTPVNCRGRNLPQFWETQDQICLYCRCRRIYENTIGKGTAKVSWRSHRCKRNRLTESLQFGTQVYSDASSIKNIGCEGSSGKNGENMETLPAWQLTKVRNKKEVIDKARNKGRKVLFASLMDLCHLKNSELEP